MKKQQSNLGGSWKKLFANGEIRFSREAERKFFFYMTVMMLLAGIIVKIT
ncbi:hypothetical protein SAMN02746065_101372 [Desulfocicer vacuolatum DSM 3385]|uniref:Uncharacterized protein n=1 Tax=Desulfocicer vacuolatum DSM 3385 TaxID=1121400 RepID=A0A1W1YU02_9BACT|nr:hypothetical protein [Desulfocicer vacuolatum]SMC39629.1 hypothetical protein SAMN02746065_101372 [Desulfocicer vacuolatum DSM 3385]